MTNTCFCRNKRCILSRQTCVCCDKTVLVVTKLYKIMSQQLFVMTKVLSRQKYFVTTNIILLRQTFCHKHTFVTTKDVTKMILVTAPANDSQLCVFCFCISLAYIAEENPIGRLDEKDSQNKWMMLFIKPFSTSFSLISATFYTIADN